MISFGFRLAEPKPALVVDVRPMTGCTSETAPKAPPVVLEGALGVSREGQNGSWFIFVVHPVLQ